MTSMLAMVAALLVAGVSGGVDPVTSVDVLPAAERTEIVIAVQGDIRYRDFTLESPTRLVVDLLDTKHALPAANFEIHRGGVTMLRTSQFSEDVVRVVFELDSNFPYQIESGDGFLKITVQSASGLFEAWSTAGRLASLTPAVTPQVDERSVADFQTAADQADIDALRAVLDRAETAVADAAVPVRAPDGAATAQQEARRITVSFTNTPIQDVLFTFAEFAGRSIVAGSEVTANVSADIRNQPWDVSLQTILESQGLAAREMATGIIRVDNIENLSERETVEPVETRPFRINYATADEIQTSVTGMLSDRGTVTTSEGTNTVIVTDIPRVLDAIERLVTDLDVRTPMVNIAAKIIFVNRTDLKEFGITYDLKDSNGNQLNLLTPGAIDLDGDGILEPPDEQIPRGTDVISLGGNSIAALGNARNRVASPTLSMLTSLLVGRYTLLTFIEALESLNLSDVQATPTLTVLDNQTARVLVGERTPLRVIDVGTQGGGGGGGGGAGAQSSIPTATVQLQETGIKLEVTPHVTAGNRILLEVAAERSAAELAESDAGFIFRTQEASSRVLVEDGETVMIAALTLTERTESRSGIPLLMNLPVVGRLFRVTREQEIQRDLIILVTPQIVRGQR